MQEPAVSVIVPTFNRLAYLRPAIESVFAQTFADWELIVADDGSTGETREFLLALQGTPRVKILFLPHTGNPGVARNAAIREARGAWIAFLDSDDLWHRQKLAEQLAAMRAHPGRLWGYTASTRIDAEGRVIPHPHNPHRKLHDGDILEPVIRWEAGIAMPTVIVEREFLLQAGAFDDAHRMFEDFDLWLRLAASCEACAVSTPLASVRHHEQHYSSQGEHALRDWIALFERWKPRLPHPRLQRALESQCVHCMARIARIQAAEGRRRAAFRTLFRDRPGAWRYRHWWSGGLRVLVHALVPPRVLGVWRSQRVRQVS